MQDLYAATSEGAPTFIDHVSCDRERKAGIADPNSCRPTQYTVTSSGNTGLKEERSISYNVGAAFEPNREFAVMTDLFLTKMNNVVGIGLDDAMKAELAGIDLAQYGVIVQRDAQGFIETIEAPQQNLSSREVFGLDFSTSYRLGKVKLATDHSHLFWYKEEGFPGVGKTDQLGENGVPKWRNVTAITFMPNDRHDLSFAALTIAGQEKSVEGTGGIPNYTTYDMQYSYRMKKLGTLTAGVKNVLGTTPPIDDYNSNQPLNIELYDQIGRQYYTGYKATF
jgi:iron complex outermembrane recepter protein